MPPSPCGTSEPFRTKLRHGRVGSTGKPSPRPLQPAAHVSPCVPVPRGCTGTALTRWLQIACVREAARAPAAASSRPVRPGYGRCAPPPQPPPRCACLPAALSRCVGCRFRPPMRLQQQFYHSGFSHCSWPRNQEQSQAVAGSQEPYECLLVFRIV